jgi:drug/metabolite transporter (DMT)-like permease
MEISRLSCFVYLIPIFSMIFSSIFLHETLEAIKVFYGIVIIAGIAIAEA